MKKTLSILRSSLKKEKVGKRMKEVLKIRNLWKIYDLKNCDSRCKLNNIRRKDYWSCWCK